MSIPNPYPNIADKEINDVKTWSSAKIINELQPALDTKIACKETYEGNIITFNNLTNKEITSLECEILPIQEGTGTPSPSNPRPISGTSVLNVEQRGVNLFDEDLEEGWLNTSTGEPQEYSNRMRSKNFCSIVPNQTYYIKCGNNEEAYWYFYDSNKIYLRRRLIRNTATTSQADECFFKVAIVGISSYSDDISLNYPSTDTDYHAYTGSTYTVNFGQTVYGGTADVVGGSGESEWGYIASYNGETITEPWFSSIDAYAEGTLPSIGAEVVYKLATPTNFTFTGVTVESLEGVNNIWCDTGDIKVTVVETETIRNILKERGILP